MSDDATEGVAEHSSRLQPSINIEINIDYCGETAVTEVENEFSSITAVAAGNPIRGYIRFYIRYPQKYISCARYCRLILFYS